MTRSKHAKGSEKRRRTVLYFALALVFMRVSMIHQILEYLLHADTYLLYMATIPLLIGILVTGALKRPFQYRAAWFWTAFALWLIPTSILSTWRGGSLTFIMAYYRTELILLFAIAGLVTTWEECRWLLYTLCAAAFVNVVSFLLLRQLDEHGRTVLPFGTVGNSNDYAAHLMFVLPFLLWFVLVTRSRHLRIAGVLALALALYEILAAGSRGALLGLVAAVLVFLFTTTSKIRRIMLIALPIAGMVVLAVLPSNVVHRIFSFPSGGSETTSEAAESAQDRERVLHDSIQFAIHHPLFGLGPDQFGNNEGAQTTKEGNKLWIEAHNSFAQVASENGFPGFFLFIGGILSTLFLLQSTSRGLAGKRGVGDSIAAVHCLRMGLIGFCATIFFVNFAYFFYLPALAGIAIAIAAGSKQRLRDIAAKSHTKVTVPSPPVAAPIDWLPEEPVQS
jgi:O-antigen ligase